MKRQQIVFILVAAMLCVAATAIAQVGPGPSKVALIADKTIDVGDVEIRNNGKKIMADGIDYGSKLMVDFELPEDGDWLVSEAHVYAGFGPIPQTKKGNPIPGQFPFKKELENPTKGNVHFTIDLESLGTEEIEFAWGARGNRVITIAVHAELVDQNGNEAGAWAYAGANATEFDGNSWGWYFTYECGHPAKGHFIDANVKGLSYYTSVDSGVTGDPGPFQYWPGDEVDFYVGNVYLGFTDSGKKVSPLDIFSAGSGDPRVVNMARLLQSLDYDSSPRGSIKITPTVRGCLNSAMANLGLTGVNFEDDGQVTAVIDETHRLCNGTTDPAGDEPIVLALVAVSPDEAQGNLEAGLNASGIFRKNVTKTEDWGENKQKLDVMPVYFPGLRSNGDPSLCYDEDGDKEYDEGIDTIGVPYEEWRLGGDPAAEECDPRDYEDPEACQVTLIECRDIAKPIAVTYLEKIDIYDDQVKEEFWPGRFAWDTFTAVSRDDGATWKRMNVSRMADMSSFELETGEPFHGSTGSPYLKINDNYILNVWESKFCKSGNPRYSITTCDDPATEEVETDDPLTEENECAVYCTGNEDNDTEVCEPDYPGDDDYYVTDIWGVRGSQRSVDYDEVDDVAELGIGEIPYSCLWAARGNIVTQKDLDEGKFASLNTEDDPETDVNDCTEVGVPYECCTGVGTGECDESMAVVLGDIIWFKPERITSGRRDVYIPTVGSARGAGFAIAWQEDPKGLRPGKGKGPGEGWSGAITNHKADMWYTYISYDDFAIVDETFESSGPAGGTDAEPDGDEGYLDKPGLGRPKALVPFALPVRISDNDMVNTNTLKVVQSEDCPTFPDSTGANAPVCFPEVVDGSFVPMDPDVMANLFCDGPDPVQDCCDHDNHETDPNCEGLEGLHGNLTGTKRYAYMARSIDEVDNATGLYTGGDGVPDYQYYVDGGGTLELCDTTGTNEFFTDMPGMNHERWFGFTNSAGSDRMVCVSSDGRLLDGDVFASRPMLQLQPYTKSDGTKSAWALLAYEESKGLGHSLADEAHEEDDVNIIGVSTDDSGQEKPIKQDLGKNMLYHSFDFSQPDLVAPGHIVNLPALCGGLYPTWCDDPKTPDVIETNVDNPTCTCDAGQPVPLYFDYWQEGTDPETDPGQWIPDDTKFLQYRTEIARRARFLMQSPGKMGDSNTLGAIIFKQGQEGQGRPADAFIRRFVKSGTGNPYKFENIECTTYLDETFDLPGCPNDGVVGYTCNVWGEAFGDRLCGGTIEATTADGTAYTRRDHINLTSSNVDLAVDAGPDDETPDDPTDDRYGTNKVLLWSQVESNLGDESYGLVHDDGTACDVLNGEVCPAMYSNVRSHRGFIRGDFFTIAYALSPNWAASRNGNDRYNFYTRRSFDGGQTWTTTPAVDGGVGVYVCPEFRTDPNSPDPDGSGNLPPEVFDETCGTYDPEAVPDGELPPAPVGIAMVNYLDPMGTSPDGLPAIHIGAGEFEPARNVSEIKSNKHTSAAPRMGTTPPTYPLDGTSPTLAKLCPNGVCVYVEDNYINNMFFVAWGTADNAKSTGGDSLKTEASPLDVYYTRSEDYGDTYFKVPWEIGGANSNLGVGEIVWRYDYVAKGEPEEQGECQLRATPDGSKMYVIWHSMISAEEDPDVIPTRWYPWKPSESHENDIWFSRKIFWPDAVDPVPAP